MSLVIRLVGSTIVGLGLLACTGLLGDGQTDGDVSTTPPTADLTDTDTQSLPGPSDTDSDVDTTTSSTTPTTGENDGFPAQYVFMSAELGWDGANDEIINPTAYGFEVVSRVEWLVATEDFLYAADPYAETSEYCTVQIIFPEGPATESTRSASDSSMYFAVDHSGLFADFYTNCNDATHDLGDLFGDDIADTLLESSGERWGMGVGDLGAEMLNILEDNDVPAEDLATVVGARVYNTDFFWSPIIEDDEWWALPVKLDASFAAEVDGEEYVLVSPEDVPDGSSISTAWYRISTWYGIYLGDTF